MSRDLRVLFVLFVIGVGGVIGLHASAERSHRSTIVRELHARMHARAPYSMDEQRSLSYDAFCKALEMGGMSMYRRSLAANVKINGEILSRREVIRHIERSLAAPCRTIYTEPDRAAISHENDGSFVASIRMRRPVAAEGSPASNVAEGSFIEMTLNWDSLSSVITEITYSAKLLDLSYWSSAASTGSSATMAVSTASVDGQSFIHVPLHDDPNINRLSPGFTNSELERHLVGSMGAAVMSNIEIEDLSGNIDPQIVIIDDSWRRIVTVTDQSNDIRAWWEGFPVPNHQLQTPVAIDIDNGRWTGTNDGANLYLIERGARPLVLRFKFQVSNNLVFQDSLSTATDGLVDPSDCALHDNATVGYPDDDSLWVLDRETAHVLAYACFGGHGVRLDYVLSTGNGVGQTEIPYRIAFGRNGPNGGSTDELYVLDRNGKIVRFMLTANSLVYETEYSLSNRSAPPVTLEDLTVDAYGQIYIVESPGSRIYKLSPDLDLLDIFDNKGESPDQLYLPTTIHNPPASESYAAYGDLIIGEIWDEFSGAQRYAIGVAASGPIPSLSDYPYGIDFSYFATDPHYLSLKVMRRPLAGGTWTTVDDENLGLRYSGTTSGVSWDVVDIGYFYVYRFELTAKSTYFPWNDPWNIHPDDPTDPDNSQTNAATLAYEIIMGNRAPTFASNAITVSQLFNGCIRSGTLTHVATAHVTDLDTPGQKNYYWYRDPLETRLLYKHPTTGLWQTSVNGPWASVGVKVVPESEAMAPDIIPVQEAALTLRVRVTDAGSGEAEATEEYGYCGGLVPCNCGAPCYCGCFHDPYCDGQIDIIDVVETVDVAFRNAAALVDPDCPYSSGRTDFDCNGATGVMDVVRVVGAAFRNDISPSVCNSPCEG